MMNDSSEKQQTQTSNDMNLSYWTGQWQANKIGFHRSSVSELFGRHLLPKLVASNQQQCVAFSLCGKTLDMKAVLDAGHRVIGIEGSPIAAEAFFKENNIAHEIETDEKNKCQIYKGTDLPIVIYCTDFFSFDRSLPPVDWIWDRGGLVAINPSDREQYRDTLFRLITPGRTRLYLVAIYYDDPALVAPPHVVSDDDINRLFGSEYSTELVEVHDETKEFNARDSSRSVRFIEEHLHLIMQKQK